MGLALSFRLCETPCLPPTVVLTRFLPFPSPEHDRHFCQWVIASVADHPVLRRVVQLIVERAKRGIDQSTEEFVHIHTGPGACGWGRALEQQSNGGQQCK